MVRPVSYSGQSKHATSPSIASASSAGSVFFLPQYTHVAEPSYISLDAANAIVASYPPPETTRNVISSDTSVSVAGLRTVNLFLDYILHEFLARAKATSLMKLRDAVALVIRTTLGTAAMVEAEQELAAYLHDSDAEIYSEDEEIDESAWNLEKVWARARIKCMIYSTLGDKEEEDFEDETEDEADYDLPASVRKLSPAAAIYLTAVLEFIGEHCCLVSASAAYVRLGNTLKTVEMSEPAMLVVEDTDVKRGIAEDDLTTRIWRKWKRSEKLLTTISNISSSRSHRYSEPRRAIDSRTGSETLTRLPFTPAQAAKELGPIDPRRNSIMSAPDMHRGDSSGSIDDPRTYSLPPTSPTKSAMAKKKHKHKHRRSVDSFTGNIRQSQSVSNIKETLGERGVMLPDSPRSSRDGAFEDIVRAKASSKEKRRQSKSIDEASLTSSRPVSSRGKEILPTRGEDDDETVYTDALATPRYDAGNPAEAWMEDRLRTPRPATTSPHSVADPQTVKKEDEEDAFVMGGEAGLDYSIWETRIPSDQRFYFSPPTPKQGSVKSDASYHMIPTATNESRPQSSHQTIVEDVSDNADTESLADTIEPISRTSIVSHDSVDYDPPSEVEVPRVQVRQPSTPTVLVFKSSITSDDESEVIPGSWPKEEESKVEEPLSQVTHLAVDAEESDAASIVSNHVNDKIASQFAELEKEKHEAARIGLGLGEIGETSQTTSVLEQGPMIINHTELTPIIESSPRESMASEFADPVSNGVGKSGSRKSGSSEEMGDTSPPPTRHSYKSSKGSPAVSTHSGDRARSSSLTSQADRLRSKFMRGKTPPEDLTVDTESTDPAVVEKRMKFEQLIRSGETMKLTLTPNSLRSIEGNNLGNEQRTVPARVRQQAKENSTRELSDFLRSTGPESFLGGTTFERRGSLPGTQTARSPPQQVVRSMPSTPVMKNGKAVDAPPVPSPKYVPRSPVATDSEHSTLQLAAFIRTTGPTETPIAPITLGGRNVAEKAAANSIHSTGDSSTAGLLRYQSVQSQRYPPSPSTSTAYGTQADDDDFDDLELSLYPGARRKQKTMQPEESLVDFLRNTGPPEPALPPSPTTPKGLRDKFSPGLTKQKSRPNVRSPEPGQPRGVDIFTAAKVQPPRVLSPTPSVQTTGTVKGNYQVGGSIRSAMQSESQPNHRHPLNVNVPTSSLMGDDFFSNKQAPQSIASRQNSVRRNDPDEIQSIRKIPSRIVGIGAALPREAVVTRSLTTDSLADFLKNTGPADFGAPVPKVVKKSKSGFFRRLFGGNDGVTRIKRSESMISGRFTPITIPASVRS